MDSLASLHNDKTCTPLRSHLAKQETPSLAGLFFAGVDLSNERFTPSTSYTKHQYPQHPPPASLIDFTSASTKRQRRFSSLSSCLNLADSGYVLLRPVQPNRTLPLPPKSVRLHAPPTTTAPTPTNAASTSDAGATASSTAPSPTRAAQAASVSTSAEVDDEGFITVANKKSRSRAAKSVNDLAPTPCFSPIPHPAPRPSVTVARPPPRQAAFPPFRMVQQDTFVSTYDAVAALEEEFPNLAIKNLVSKDGSSVLLPKDEATYNQLSAISSEPDTSYKLLQLDPQTHTTKAVVMGYPLRMPHFLSFSVTLR